MSSAARRRGIASRREAISTINNANTNGRAAYQKQFRCNQLCRLQHRVVRNGQTDEEVVEAISDTLGAAEIVLSVDRKRDTTRLRAAGLEIGRIHAAEKRRAEIVDRQEAVGDIRLLDLAQGAAPGMGDQRTGGIEHEQFELGGEAQLVEILVEARQRHVDAEHRPGRAPRLPRQRDPRIRHIGEPIGLRQDRVCSRQRRRVPGSLSRIECRGLGRDAAQHAPAPIDDDPARRRAVIRGFDQHERIGRGGREIGADFGRSGIVETLDDHMCSIGPPDENAHGGRQNLLEILENRRQHPCEFFQRQIGIDGERHRIEH